jgi:hypothetical membrane protein
MMIGIIFHLGRVLLVFWFNDWFTTSENTMPLELGTFFNDKGAID